MMMDRKIKLSAVQPEGDKNGLNQPEALAALTEGYSSEVHHLAVVELVVAEQTTSIEGVLTNRVKINRIELVDGGSADHALDLLRKAYAARQHETLEGMDDEQIGGRGDE